MTIIEKIKQSIEGATGLTFLYHAAGEINELIARCKELPVAYSFLIDSGTIDDVNGRYHERVTLAVMFCDKTEFDFNALENEEIIDRIKKKAYKWLQSLRMSNALRIVSINSTQRLYDNTTDILTGFAVNITIEDIAGVGECELPEVIFEIKENGAYPVVGVDKVVVAVPNSLTDLVVTENGKEYLPIDYGVHGFGSVKTDIPKVKVTMFKVNDECINEDGRWDGDKMIDTSECTTMNSAFAKLKKLKILDTTGWELSKVTDFRYFVDNNVGLQQIIGIENWNTSSALSFSYFARGLYGSWRNLYIDLRRWDVSKVTDFSGFFSFGGGKLNMENWDTRKVTNFRQFLYNTHNVSWVNMVGFSAKSVTNFTFTLSASATPTIVGDYTIDDVINNNLKVFEDAKISINITNVEVTKLNRASLRAIINGLADLTGQTAQQLVIGSVNTAKLTDEDIAIATNKNWTIA